MIGDRYIQIGEWRLGAIDDNHASMSHKDGKTAQIYRNDGTLHGTSGRTDWGCYGWSGKCGTAGPTCQLGDGKAAVRLTSLTYSTKKLCKYNSELNHIRNMTKPEDDDLKLDPVAVLPGQYSNKEPEGWSVEERTQRPYFHEYDGNTKKWVRNKALEFGPFPGKKVTVMTNGSRGFIISAGKYECDDKGENCALKYQDEVESNISFLDFAAKRKVNNRRPVLGKAMPWMKLGCAMATKIDEIDFSEFVVRHDCPPYSESDIREAEEAGSSPEEYFAYPSCYRGIKANAPVHYTHDDRTDPSRMKNRPAEIGTREPILQTPHICYIDEARPKCVMNSLPKNYVANKAICDAKPGCMWDPKAKVAGGPYGKPATSNYGQKFAADVAVPGFYPECVNPSNFCPEFSGSKLGCQDAGCTFDPFKRCHASADGAGKTYDVTPAVQLQGMGAVGGRQITEFEYRTPFYGCAGQSRNQSGHGTPDECEPAGGHPVVPVDPRPMTDQVIAEQKKKKEDPFFEKNFGGHGNVHPAAFKDIEYGRKSDKVVSWKGNHAHISTPDRIVDKSTMHRLPPSYKGWVGARTSTKTLNWRWARWATAWAPTGETRKRASRIRSVNGGTTRPYPKA